jgi:hypothetical protein
MTKEQYFSMCEQMRSEPLESEIPVDYEDLPEDAHYAIQLFNILPDKIDGFAGIYFGKDFSGLADIMDTLAIPDKYHTLHFLTILINITKKQYAAERSKSNGK